MNTPGARLERRARLELGDYPLDAAWSADGRVLLVGCGQGALLWVDVAGSAAAAQRIGAHAGGALALAWQHSGQRFASSGQDGEVRLWDAQTRVAKVIHAATDWSEHLAFASHGRLLAVATGRALQVFGSDGTLRTQLPPQPGVIAATRVAGQGQ